MYVLAHTATPKNGTAPAVLTAYAAWGHSYLPEYSPSIVPWLDAGGIYVIANLRGGGEFGDAWRLAGSRHNRQNSVDDLIAAAKFLGSSGYANSAKIGIIGLSAGGELVCAAMTQRPELFRAVVAQVPVCDLIRYPYFLLGHLWTKEMGDPEDSQDFPFLLARSPYHHVREGIAYPATLFFTSDGDMNVDPMHTRKMAARMQAATADEQPILVHIEKDLPHNMGRPRGKQVEELANIWSFFAWQLGVRW
jgi:prolyl oligopeptidase